MHLAPNRLPRASSPALVLNKVDTASQGGVDSNKTNTNPCMSESVGLANSCTVQGKSVKNPPVTYMEDGHNVASDMRQRQRGASNIDPAEHRRTGLRCFNIKFALANERHCTLCCFATLASSPIHRRPISFARRDSSPLVSAHRANVALLFSLCQGMPLSGESPGAGSPSRSLARCAHPVRRRAPRT